ncbi:MAG: ASKHA domain-containing protein [Candidatus Gygaella obscura]|nr:ASKHA domain-containing protein [Candidatus Gygaella obscura]
MDKVKVRFLPEKKEIQVSPGTTLLSAALDCGIFLNSHCAGDGTCGGCKVCIRKGSVKFSSAYSLTEKEKKAKTVLACQAIVDCDVEVFVLSESRMHSLDTAVIPKIKQKDFTVEDVFLNPDENQILDPSSLIEKIYLELPKPGENDNLADTDRLINAIKKVKNASFVEIGISEVKIISGLLRACQWKVTVSLIKTNNTYKIVNIEPFDTHKENYSMVFDIGTTTINGSLVDLNSGRTISTKTSYNKQILLGGDVITRIIFSEKNSGLKIMNSYMLESINDIIKNLLKESNIKTTYVNCFLCVGNPTMMHLFFKVNPSYIRKDPYTPVCNEFPVVKASQNDLNISASTTIHSLSGVSSYVGSDITSGILYSRLHRQENTSLFIDIGTNGEIVLGNKDWLVCAAASAGPAFEGSSLTNGVRAIEGAIEDVTITDDLKIKVKTINDFIPLGVCGSGYINLLAQMLKAGIIDRNGSFKDEAHMVIRKRQKCFVVVKANKTSNKKDILISVSDIDNLKRAKAAIYAASCVLLKEMQLSFKQIDKVFIAGGFGTALDVDSAIAIGLLPNLGREKFVFLGNAALKGAKMAVLSKQSRSDVKDIASKMTYFNLSGNSFYMDEYMSALFFPHTDLSRFV